MKGILINSTDRTVSEVEIDKNNVLKDLYKNINGFLCLVYG